MPVTFLQRLVRRRVLFGVAGLLLAGGGLFVYRKFQGDSAVVRYVLAAAERGTLVTSVTGTGQVAVTSQVDLKAKASGTVLNLAVSSGQEVKTGSLLVELDASDANQAVRDAATSLESAKLSLEKLRQPARAYELLSAENALAAGNTSLEKLKLAQQTEVVQSKEARQKADDNLMKAREDAYNAIANVFLDLPDIFSGLFTMVYSNDLGKSEPTAGAGRANDSALLSGIAANDLPDRDKLSQLLDAAKAAYDRAKVSYAAAFSAYKETSRYAASAAVEDLLEEVIETTKLAAEAVKRESNALDYWVDYRTTKRLNVFALVASYQGNVSTFTTQTSNHLSTLFGIQRTWQDNKDARLNAERDLAAMAQNYPLDLAAAEATVRERTSSLDQLQSGADPLDIKTQEIAVRQRQDALADTRLRLANYRVVVPFDGVIASIAVQRGDTVSAGTALATLITRQRTAEISLNEVDVAKIQVGQKATLTFDAVEGLTITGEVAEIDQLATVSQGVVTYNVTIPFATQDERVKPGMSVSAAIITDIRQEALLVPNSAVKSQGDGYYVEMLEAAVPAGAGSQEMTSPLPPRIQPVEIGLANDTATEITSGLAVGDRVVVRTVSTQTTTRQQAPSLFGGGGAGGGGFRVPR